MDITENGEKALKATITETSTTVRELELEIPAEQVNETFEEKIGKYRKEIDLKGFRKGKLPRNIVVARFGKAIRTEAVEETVDKAIRDELEKAKIEPVSQASMEDFSDDKEKGVKVKIRIEVDPEIEITDYTNLGVELGETEVSDADVDAEMQRALESVATPEKVDRPAEKGDLVSGEYLFLELGGEMRPLPEDPSFQAKIGSGTGSVFDEQLVGVSVGEEKDVLHSYPDDHSDNEFRGKEAKARVKVTEVSAMVLPTEDDELAKKFGAENIDDLRSKMRDSLERGKRDNALTKAREEAVDKVLEKNPFDVPEARVRHYIEAVKHEEEARRNPEHAQEKEHHHHVSDEELEAMRPQAERTLRRHRVLEYVGEREKIKVKQSDVDSRVKEMADSFGYPFEELKASLRQSGRITQIREDLKTEKTLDFIAGIGQES